MIFFRNGNCSSFKKIGKNLFWNEKDKKYFRAALERVNKAKKIEDDFLDTIENNNKSKPRVPFGSLVELGIVQPGTLYSIKEKN